MVIMNKRKRVENGVSSEHALKHLIESTAKKCKTAADIYEDKDGMRADDINALAGQRTDKKGGDVWSSFYDKVKEVKDYHRRFSINQGLPELQNPQWFYERAMENDPTETLFSGEEDTGKKVDMHKIYSDFINMKKLATNRKTRFKNELFARMKRKDPNLKPDDKSVEEAVKKEYNELDYITWLKSFDQFHDTPRYCKYKEKVYTEYLDSVIGYLREFLSRSQPLVDIAKLEQQFEKEFESRWADKSIPGWSEPSHKEKLFCLPTDKLFNSEAVMKSHKSGKLYKKRLEEVQKMSLDKQQKLTADSEEEDKRIARLESICAKWHDLLSETIGATVDHLQKKQSQTADEMDMDKDDDEDDEDDGVDIDPDEMEEDEDRPVYNPLNLPLGWDGKPIPFWLYKLHGLGIEYKCEICGNYSYWGTRAFEEHFTGWRHAFGMRCLGIPNTSHFKWITKIEDAVTLYEKLKKDAEDQTFRPDQDVECEDIQGNVMSQRAFEDLRRQGLV
jgi:hypothetical protein